MMVQDTLRMQLSAAQPLSVPCLTQLDADARRGDLHKEVKHSSIWR
jgi:hypothetical protein